MKDAYYFPHDSNARNDIKMIRFRAKRGYEGYGIFWAIIEVLREQSGWKIDADSVDVLSIAIGIEPDKLNEIITELIDIKLLKKSGNFISSDSLTRRMEHFEERRKTYRDNGKKGGRPKSKTKPNQNLNHNLNTNLNKSIKVSKGNKGNKTAFLSSFFSDYKIPKDGIFRNGTTLNQKKIFIWNIFETLGYEKPPCAKYFDKIHDRNFCDNKGDPYTVESLVDEILYYHKREWLNGGSNEQDSL